MAIAVAAWLSCVPPERPTPPRPWTQSAYDSHSVTQFGGNVISVDDVRATDAAFTGLHVLVRVEHSTLSVHLGPKRFFEDQDVNIVPGDQIDATGLLTTYEGRPAVVATRVKKGDREFALPERNPTTDAGVPLFFGTGRDAGLRWP